MFAPFLKILSYIKYKTKFKTTDAMVIKVSTRNKFKLDGTFDNQNYTIANLTVKCNNFFQKNKSRCKVKVFLGKIFKENVDFCIVIYIQSL